MKDIEFLGVGLKIFGFYCGLMSIGMLTSATVMSLSANTYSEVSYINYINYFPAILMCMAAIILIKFPVSLAKMLIPRSSTESTKLNFEKNNILFCGLVLLGVYILIYAVPDLFHNIYLLVQIKEFMVTDTYRYKETTAFTISTIVEIMIGLYLVLGSRGLVKLIDKLRS